MRKPFVPNPLYDDGMPTLTEKQARQSQDQEPFHQSPGGIPVYDAHPPKAGPGYGPSVTDSGRRYGPMGLYLSPAEEEAILAAPAHAGEFAELGMMAVPLAPAKPFKPIVPGCRWCRDGEVACGLTEGCKKIAADLKRDAMVREAAFENCLAAEAMGIPTEDVMEALGQSDMVNLPEHYARFKIEPIRFICENGLDFFQGNIVKYVLRHDAKNGMEDLQKAKRYLEMLIKFKGGDPDWWRA